MTGMSILSLWEMITVRTRWIILFQVITGSLKGYRTKAMKKGEVEITAINIEEAAIRTMKRKMLLRMVTPSMTSCTLIHQLFTKGLPLI